MSFTSLQTPPLSGSTAFRSLVFGTSEIIDPFVPNSGTSFLDGTPLSLEDILMLPTMFDNPLLQSRLSFTDAYTICTDLCRSDYVQSTQMRIDSLNRYVASVPEPGTLGLMGLGLGLTCWRAVGAANPQRLLELEGHRHAGVSPRVCSASLPSQSSTSSSSALRIDAAA